MRLPLLVVARRKMSAAMTAMAAAPIRALPRVGLVIDRHSVVIQKLIAQLIGGRVVLLLLGLKQPALVSL